jgi:hypothetical protein
MACRCSLPFALSARCPLGGGQLSRIERAVLGLQVFADGGGRMARGGPSHIISGSHVMLALLFFQIFIQKEDFLRLVMIHT